MRFLWHVSYAGSRAAVHFGCEECVICKIFPVPAYCPPILSNTILLISDCLCGSVAVNIQAPGVLLHQLLEVLNRGGGGTAASTSGSGGSAAGMEECPPGVVGDLLAMMEQLGQVRKGPAPATCRSIIPVLPPKSP